MPGAPKRLRCEYLDNPLGIDATRPRLSWWLDDDRPAEIQTAYRIIAASQPSALDDETGDLWDSGRVESSATAHIPWAGAALRSRQRVYWRVRAFDSDGIGSAWSRTAFFEMGLLEAEDWRARWIGAPLMGGKRTPAQVPALRRAFDLPQPPESARLYITALGVYDVEINGKRAIDFELAPGWTDYRTRVRYQVVDVTPHLVSGENVIGVLLGDGWYCGLLGASERQQYGDRPALLAQLEIVLADGGRMRIVSDDLWKWHRSPILYSDLMDGESFDARQSLAGWSSPGGNEAGWSPVEVTVGVNAALCATMSPMVRVIDRLEPIGAPSQRSGSFDTGRWVFDFGQNLVGRVRLTVRARRGTQLEVRHAERLDESGELYTANLRGARAIDYYTCAGTAGGETFEPRFTLHGFQFIEVRGRLEENAIEAVTAQVISSALPAIGEFQSDHPLLNQLHHNIVWSQRGNFIDIPTDCPQRDERLGWTGDAQIFARTAAFNLETAPFFGKWLIDVSDAQTSSGAIPMVAPVPPALKFFRTDGGPAWADAIVICPWTLYRCFGDRVVLDRHYGAMSAFVNDLQRRYPSLIRGEAGADGWQGFGDWLATDGPSTGDARFGTTPKDLVGTALFCYSAKLLARIAGVLGNLSDLERYEDLAQRVRSAFRRRFVTADGRLVGETQTAYVLALHFALLDAGETGAAFASLVRDIEARGFHLSTGFVGTPYLLHVLTNYGRLDLAYRLLLQTTPPSWLYPVTQGATTVWERWDGWTETRGFQDPQMNSFNHYAYGAVGEWIYGTLGGLELDPDLSATRNAYRYARIAPRPPIGEQFPNGAPIRYSSVALDTMHGRYEVDWEISGGVFRLKTKVPANCRARVILPSGDSSEVVAGRHEFSLSLSSLADDGIPVLSEVTEIAS